MKLNSTNAGRSCTAFTLIDVVVGMGILGIVMASLFASFSFGFNVVKLSREELQATQLLQEKMESIRLYNWEQATGANTTFQSPLAGTSTAFFTGTISNSIPGLGDEVNYSADLRQITVTVSWTNNNVLHSRSSTTYVSKDGLFNYKLN
jgi:type II secretory pathway pseudopilin PulG